MFHHSWLQYCVICIVWLLFFRGRKVFEPPRYMTVSQAAEQLLTVLQRRRDEGKCPGIYTIWGNVEETVIAAFEYL